MKQPTFFKKNPTFTLKIEIFTRKLPNITKLSRRPIPEDDLKATIPTNSPGNSLNLSWTTYLPSSRNEDMLREKDVLMDDDDPLQPKSVLPLSFIVLVLA